MSDSETGACLPISRLFVTGCEDILLLHVNGYRLDINDLDAYQFLMHIYETNRFTSRSLNHGFGSTPKPPLKHRRGQPANFPPCNHRARPPE